MTEVPSELPEDKFDTNNDIVLSYAELAGDRNWIASRLNELIRWIKAQIPTKEN